MGNFLSSPPGILFLFNLFGSFADGIEYAVILCLSEELILILILLFLLDHR
jgi:hypothetical protein